MTRTFTNSEVIIFPQDKGQEMQKKLKEFFTDFYYGILPLGQAFPEGEKSIKDKSGNELKPHFEVPSLTVGWDMKPEDHPLYVVVRRKFNYEVNGGDHEFMDNQEKLNFLGLTKEYIEYMVKNHKAYTSNGKLKTIRMYHGTELLSWDKSNDLNLYTNMKPIVELFEHMLEEVSIGYSTFNLQGNFEPKIMERMLSEVLNPRDMIDVEIVEKWNNPIVWNDAINLYIHVATGDLKKDLEVMLDFYSKGFNVEYTTVPNEYHEQQKDIYDRTHYTEVTEYGTLRCKWGETRENKEKEIYLNNFLPKFGK